MAHLGSILMEITGESAEIKHWGLYRDDKVAWFTETSIRYWQTTLLLWWQLSMILNSSSALFIELKSRGLSDQRVCWKFTWFESLTNVLYQL